MHEKPTSLETYVSVPRGVGTADTTTLSITRCAFRSVFPTAASIYVTVSLAHASNYLEQVCCHWPWFVHCHYHGKEKEEEKSNLFKASAFLSFFGRPNFTPIVSLSEAKDFGGSRFLLRK